MSELQNKLNLINHKAYSILRTTEQIKVIELDLYNNDVLDDLNEEIHLLVGDLLEDASHIIKILKNLIAEK